MSLDLSTSRQPDHPVATQFPMRWSPRSFSDRKLGAGEVLSVLEAARWAPSASNHQPWRFVWALREDGDHAAILGALVPGNQTWAGKAAALIVVASTATVTGKDGAETANKWSAFDAGAAWMSLSLQAQAMGLVSHAMGGFDAVALERAVGLPEGHSLHAVVALGHQGPIAALPEPLQAREAPNSRHPVSETAFRGRF